MYYRSFHGRELSALGMGCLRLPLEQTSSHVIDRVAAQTVIDAAFEHGINYFDTAYTYQNGDSERFLGEVLAHYPRESFFLTTKYYGAIGKDVENVFEEQLRRCRTDYFDIYMFHGLNEGYFPHYTDSKQDILGYLLKQKERGRIRYLGFSSHAKPETLERFLKWYDSFDMAQIQLNYLDWSIMDTKREYDILTAHDVPVWVMEPLRGGRLSTLNEEARQILKDAAPERSISSWGMRFLMGLPNVQMVLSGMSTLEQVIDNADTFSSCDPLSEKEQQALKRAIQAFFKDLGVPCTSCRYCCDTCPAELDIPSLIKAYNEYSISGGTWRLAAANNGKGPEQCVGCGVCAKRCPQNIRIPDVMRRFSQEIEQKNRTATLTELATYTKPQTYTSYRESGINPKTGPTFLYKTYP